MLIKMALLKRWGRFYKECVRVLKVTKKPSNEEFKTIVKVSGLGILVIGLIGFIVHIIFRIFKPF